MKLRFSPRARRDQTSIARYISFDSPAAAHRVLEHIERRCWSLVEHPDQGSQRSGGLRVLVVTQTPYLVYYRVLGGHDHHSPHSAREAATLELRTPLRIRRLPA